MPPLTLTLATAISNLSVAGVTIKNVTAIPRMVKPSDCPVLFPDPTDWLGEMQTDPDLDFIGQAGQFDVVETMKYIYLHAASSAATTIGTYYSAMATNRGLLYNAIGNMTTNAAMVKSIRVSQFGELQAPAISNSQIRNIFFGCYFEITFKELVNP